MTVIREKTEYFHGALSTVKDAVDKTLIEKHLLYKYTNTKITEENIVTTIIKPIFWPLFLTTKLEISINQENENIVVKAKTISQKHIKGDIFRMYNGYLNDFFTKLQNNS